MYRIETFGNIVPYPYLISVLSLNSTGSVLLLWLKYRSFFTSNDLNFSVNVTTVLTPTQIECFPSDHMEVTSRQTEYQREPWALRRDSYRIPLLVCTSTSRHYSGTRDSPMTISSFQFSSLRSRWIHRTLGQGGQWWRHVNPSIKEVWNSKE